jgi:hypothetical protein
MRRKIMVFLAFVFRRSPDGSLISISRAWEVAGVWCKNKKWSITFKGLSGRK